MNVEDLKLLEYDGEGWRENRPIGSILLLIFFYIIGVIIYEPGTFPTIDTGKYLIRFDIVSQFGLLSKYEVQWQIFTYHLIHFGIIHYAYSGGLIFYYIQGLERITSAKFVIVGYFLIASLAPFILGIFAIGTMTVFPPAKKYFFTAGYFIGSSVGIWGLIGISTPVSYKRPFYWVFIVILLVIEVILKLVVGRTDILSNISHLLTFLVCWGLSALFIRFNNTDGRIGAIKPLKYDYDKLLAFLVFLHASILVIYFLQIFNIFPTKY